MVFDGINVGFISRIQSDTDKENSFKSFRKVITIMLSTQAENGLWAVVGLHFRADDDMVIVAIVWQRFSTLINYNPHSYYKK